MLIYLNSSLSRTQLSLSVTLNISTRLVGGKKPPGHVHKILESLTKPKPMFTNTPMNPVTKQSSHVFNNKQAETFTKLKEKDNQATSFKEPTSIKKQVENSPVSTGMHTPKSMWTNINIESISINQSIDIEEPTTIPNIPLILIQENSQKGVPIPYEDHISTFLIKISYRDNDLIIRGLLKYSKNAEGLWEAKLTKDFFEKFNVVKASGKVVKINDEDLNITSNDNKSFGIGLLQVSNVLDTAFLTGLHVHAGIGFTFMNNHKIIWSYLTSTKGPSSVKLSDTQPLNFDEPLDNPKQQMMCFLDKPLIITEDQLSPFSDRILPNGEVKKQQEILEDYIKKHDNVLKDHFKNNVIPKIKKNDYNIERYNGTGITETDIINVINLNDKIAEDKVEKIFKQYIQQKKQKKSEAVDSWYETKASTLDKFTLNLLEKRIKDHEKL